MAELLDPKEVVPFDELPTYEVIQSEALINLLGRKGIVTKQELLEEMKRVKETLPNKPRPALTEEDAQNIVNDYMEQQKPRSGRYKITDSVPKNCNAYTLPQNDCWYVVCSSYQSPAHIICSSRIIAISKTTGEVIYDGDACDEG